MKKIILCISTLALLAIACQKLENNVPLNGDEMAPAVKMITETISGSRGVETKATIDDVLNFAWETGDNVAVHISNGKYVYTSDEGASGAIPKPDPNADVATFTVVYEAGYERDAFAVYPSTIVDKDAANYGQSGHALDVTLPSSYPLAQVEGEVSPCPMIATNAAGAGWDFYQLCGLLRLTVNNIPPSTKRLEIDFNGNKVCGAFSVSIQSPLNKSVIATADATGDNDVITITNSGNTFYSGWGDGKVFNIPLPTGTYSNITVTAYDASVNGNAILTVTYPFAYTATNTKGKKLTVSLPVFSVSADKRVLFSPGNLQASTSDNGAHWTWGFAANQWDIASINNNDRGTQSKYYHNERINGNGTVSYSGAGIVDLFCWVGASNTTWSGDRGTTLNAAMYGITNSQTMNSTETYGDVANESLKSDWGNTINDGYSWRTPTSSQWAYLLGIRARGGKVNGKSNARFALARINTNTTAVNGLILFPDGVTIESSEVTQWGKINEELGNSWTITWENSATQCTTDQWTALAAKGCVFLPMAGAYRYYEKTNTQERTPVYQPGTSAGYWSSSPVNATQAYFVSISIGYVDPRPDDHLISNDDRKRGHSVRLVRDIN